MKFKICLSRMVEEIAIIEVEAEDKKAMIEKIGLEEFFPPEDAWESNSCWDSGEVTHVNGEWVEDFCRKN